MVAACANFWRLIVGRSQLAKRIGRPTGGDFEHVRVNHGCRTSEWPSNSRTVRVSVPVCSRCVANECRLCRARHRRHTNATRLTPLVETAFRSYNERMPTWDNSKRRENIRKHGYDFPGCERVFDGPVWVYEDKRLAYGEFRLCAVGWLDGKVMHMTYTERGDDFHVISLREAEKYEVNRFFQEIAH